MINVGSDFSGVGSFIQALQRLELEHKEVFACDIDKYARKVYAMNFGEPDYFPSDVYERDIPKESLDIYMTSPPCQSFSLAGKRKGEDDKRGILFYNSHEFIKKNNPRYFIFENVKGLLSDDKKNKDDEYGNTFNKWITYLGGKSVNGKSIIFPHEESVPYHIYFQVLNAKNYGIPQNRERIFIIGIRDDIDNDFSFPKPIFLEKRLKDVLEENVDEKYYLSEKMINGFINKTNGFEKSFKPINENETLANCITTKPTDNVTANFIKVGCINQDTQASQVFSENGIASTISAGTHGYANGYVETTVGTWRTHEDGRGFRPTEDNNCPTIPARAREDGSGQPVVKILGYSRDSKGKVISRHEKDLANTIHTSSGSGGNTDQYVVLNWIKGGLQANQPKQTNGISPCLTSAMGMGGGQTPIHNYQQRIRRLTPTEAFRLMDFNEDFIEKTINSKLISDSQLYKMAGNSICVGVLVEIIKKLKL